MAVAHDGVFGQGRVASHHKHLHRFALLRVQYADGGAFQHAGAKRDHVFNLVGVDVEATDQNHVLFAVNDARVALGVHDANVARAQKAVGRESVGVFLRLLVVAGRDVRATDADFARAAQCHAVAVLVLDGQVDAGQWQADGAAETCVVDRVVGADGAGLAHAPAFDHGGVGHLLPFACRAFGRCHATGLRHAQRRKVQRAELRVLQERVEQRVDRRQHVKRPLLQHLDKLWNVARVRYQRQVRALADGQQAQRERKDVVQRQRGNVVCTAGIAQALQRRGKPGLGLQHGGNDVAVCQHRTFGQPGGAAGVLQKGGAIERRLAGCERVACALRQCIAKARHLLPAGQRQHKGRHHLGQVAHRKGDPCAVGRAQQVAHRCQHHMAHSGARQHFGQRVGKVFQDDDGGGA